MPESRSRTPTRRRLAEFVTAALHLAVLWAFAFAQPLLDLLGDTPEFFVARGNTRGDILVLAFAVTLVPPLVLALVELLVGFVSDSARRALHLVFVAILAAAFALQLLSDVFGGPGELLVALAVVAGVGTAWAYARTRPVPALLTVLSPVPLLFLFVFLVISPTSELVLPSGDVDASKASLPQSTPVVMIVFDEFSGYSLMGRDGRIDASRFPSFARLARDGTWYRNASSVADFTNHAVPALLTGERPEQGAAPIAADHPESLFTFLGGKYRFDVTEPVTDVCPEQLCPAEAASRPPAKDRLHDLYSDLRLVSAHLLLPDDLADGLPAVDRSFADFRKSDQEANGDAQLSAQEAARAFAAIDAVIGRVTEFNAFTSRLGKGGGGRRLHFLHVQLPHNPYHFLPNGQRYPDPLAELPGLEKKGAPAGKWSKDRWLAREAFARYLLQLQYADRLLGQAMAALRRSGQYERSLVVVMADHGVSFTPGSPHRAVRASNLPEIASIPLFIKGPGQRRGRVVNTNVRSIDVLPTIAARLGTHLPWSTDGRSADRAPDGGTVTLERSNEGGSLSLPFDRYVSRRDGLIGRMVSDLRLDRPSGPFGAGPDADLVGTPVAALRPSTAAGAGFELDSAGLSSSFDPQAAVVPALVTGRLTGHLPGKRLALAAAGRVVAVTVPYRDEDVERFAALVPPQALAQAGGRLELFVVEGSGPSRHLVALRGASTGFRLVKRGGREAIVDSAGHETPVGPGIEGFIEALAVGDVDVTIKGWAGDTDEPRPADRVMAFSGSRLLGSGRPYVKRPDLKKAYGPRMARAGYQLSGWARGPKPGSPDAPVRVFAIVGNRASELKILGAR